MLPLYIGHAYEMYAYAARALGTRSWNVDVIHVDNFGPFPSQPSSTTRISNNSQTLPLAPLSLTTSTNLQRADMPGGTSFTDHLTTTAPGLFMLLSINERGEMEAVLDGEGNSVQRRHEITNSRLAYALIPTCA